MINLDFADVRAVMNEMGMALMGTGRGSGENRARAAAEAAIANPLLEELSIKGARGVLINITGGPDMTLHEVHEAATLVREEAHEDANIIFGSVIQEGLENEIRVTVIATGLPEAGSRKWRQPESAERLASVTPLRPPMREDATPESMTESTFPAASAGGAFLSPFEEEYEVPAFIRRGRQDSGRMI
jgi:cell division protein FtsZ